MSELVPNSEKDFFKFLLMQRVLHRTLYSSELWSNGTERDSAGSIPRSFWEVDPALPRSVLFEF